MSKEIELYRQVEVSSQIVEIQKSEIERQREVIEGMGRIINALMKELKEAQNIKKENASYRDFIGDFDTPTLILREMYKNGRIGIGCILTPPTQFKHPAIEYKKPNRDKITYWVSLFEDWGICETYSSRHYISEVSFREAKKILKNKLGEHDEK